MKRFFPTNNTNFHKFNYFSHSKKSILRPTLVIILLIASVYFAQAQEIRYNNDGSVDLHFKTVQEWEQYKKKIIFLNYDKKECDSLKSEVYLPTLGKFEKIRLMQDSVIKTNKETLKKCDEQNARLMGDLLDLQTKRPPAIEWVGFYAGMGTGYFFVDSVMNKATIVNAMWDNVYFTGKGMIKIDRLMLTGTAEIPIKGKAGIKVEAGWRLF